MGVIVTGGMGMLGGAVVEVLHDRGIVYQAFNRRFMDVTCPSSAQLIPRTSTVINCAGIVKGRPDVSDAEMVAVNAVGPHLLADRVERLVHISTDCVFSGRNHVATYDEEDRPNPDDLYGRSKLAGEPSISPDSGHVILRGSFIGFGPRGLLAWLLGQPEGARVDGYASWAWSGLYIKHFANIVVEIALNPSITGLLHIPGPWVTKLLLLNRIAAKIRPDLTVVPKVPPGRDMILTSKRPEWEDIHIPDWDEMLEELAKDYGQTSHS